MKAGELKVERGSSEGRVSVERLVSAAWGTCHAVKPGQEGELGFWYYVCGQAVSVYDGPTHDGELPEAVTCRACLQAMKANGWVEDTRERGAEWMWGVVWTVLAMAGSAWAVGRFGWFGSWLVVVAWVGAVLACVALWVGGRR